MTTQEEHLETRITELEIELEQAQERIRHLQADLADMTKIACDYKEANTRLENDYREYIEANYVSKASLETSEDIDNESV